MLVLDRRESRTSEQIFADIVDHLHVAAGNRSRTETPGTRDTTEAPVKGRKHAKAARVEKPEGQGQLRPTISIFPRRGARPAVRPDLERAAHPLRRLRARRTAPTSATRDTSSSPGDDRRAAGPARARRSTCCRSRSRLRPRACSCTNCPRRPILEVPMEHPELPLVRRTRAALARHPGDLQHAAGHRRRATTRPRRSTAGTWAPRSVPGTSPTRTGTTCCRSSRPGSGWTPLGSRRCGGTAHWWS